MDIYILLFWLKIVLYLVIIFIFIFTFFATTTIYTIIKTGVPFAQTPDKNIKIIFSELNLPKSAKIYDLGCGNGKVLFMAEKLGLIATGYELAPCPYLKSRLKKFLIKSQVQIFRKDFFLEKIDEADAVFIFLVNAVMEKTGAKLKAELKPNALVASYGFKLPGWQIAKTLETKPSQTYLYVKN